MAKQNVSQRYIYKIHSSRLRKAKWNLTLPLPEARKNGEIVSLADSQMLRWIDELNGVVDADVRAKDIKGQIRRLRKETNSLENRRSVRRLYEQLDSIQFKPDYLCIIIDKKKDYLRACRGFKINGVLYQRLLGTNGGIKKSTIVFVSARLRDELLKRIDNGRDTSKELVPAKFEAYRALTCSASIPVSMPKGILVVPDCETKFLSDIIYLNDESAGEPVMEKRWSENIAMNASDGFGLMLPSLAERWAEDLHINYIPSGVNTRFAWEKGMVFCFDFIDFAEKVAKNYIVSDAWGNEVDIRNVEIILTTSMVKLWDSYDDCDNYLRHCEENGYTFGIAKVCPQNLESERNLNYQFVQSYKLSEADIGELIAPTMNEIADILGGDYRKTILYLKGVGLNEFNVLSTENDFGKALMINPEMTNDPYVRSKIYQLIKNRINEAKIGVLKVHGNYSIVSGDPYTLCQSVFGLTLTGILQSGEIYNKYWLDVETDKVVCFRAPMTWSGNIRILNISQSEDAQYWYRYMNTCTILNSWDTTTHALNGMDYDGDLVMLTDNRVLLERLDPSPALLCIQRKAPKKVIAEEDLIKANIDSFGDEIGKITNRVTTMFEVQAGYAPDSEEYKVLDYRIKCGQLFQQNAIDKSKGIIARPMPREWYDRHHASAIKDIEQRKFNLSILAEKKPYFMRYVYSDLARRYSRYIKDTSKKTQQVFNTSIEDLLVAEPSDMTELEAEFVKYYGYMMPVGTGDCTVNNICHRFEERFDGYFSKQKDNVPFDYTIMYSGSEYTKSQYNSVFSLYKDYNSRLKDYVIFFQYERLDSDEVKNSESVALEDFLRACLSICSNEKCLCDILLDICYKRNSSKHFVWDMCGDVIIENLLEKSGYRIEYPTADESGDIFFGGKTFLMRIKEFEGVNE